MFTGILSFIPFAMPVTPDDAPLLAIKDYVNYTRPVKIQYPASMSSWSVISSSMSFDALSDACYVSFKGNLLVIGGRLGGVLNPFIFYSANGISWSRITAGFSPRFGAVVIEFNDLLWLLGGNDGTTDLNTVYNSADGLHWNAVTLPNPFTARSSFMACVANSYLYIAGGIASGNDDVWKSADGYNWVRISTGSAFGVLSKSSMTFFDNTFWMIGGYDSSPVNSVWSSADAITWSLTTSSAFSSGRYGHAVLEMYGRLFVFCGNDGLTALDTIYQSADGIVWSSLATPTGLTARDNLGAVVLNDSVYIFGGASATLQYILPFDIIVDDVLLPSGESVCITGNGYHEIFLVNSDRHVITRICSLMGSYWLPISSDFKISGDFTSSFVSGAACRLIGSDGSGDASVEIASASFDGTYTTLVLETVPSAYNWDFICLVSDQTVYLDSIDVDPVYDKLPQAVADYLVTASLSPRGDIPVSSWNVDFVSDKTFFVKFFSGDSHICSAAVLPSSTDFEVKLVPNLKVKAFNEVSALLLDITIIPEV